MLVLSRKKDEAIIMKIPGHEDIRLTVVRIDNMNKVRIGVEADKDVVVLRSELASEAPALENPAELRNVR
jgi:carbon storage regulator CsrA